MRFQITLATVALAFAFASSIGCMPEHMCDEATNTTETSSNSSSEEAGEHFTLNIECAEGSVCTLTMYEHAKHKSGFPYLKMGQFVDEHGEWQLLEDFMFTGAITVPATPGQWVEFEVTGGEDFSPIETGDALLMVLETSQADGQLAPTSHDWLGLTAGQWIEVQLIPAY